jgi:Mg-chelatase subunit ChlD
MKDTEKAFVEIAKKGGGQAVWSRGADDLSPLIAGLLEAEIGKDLELVLCIDTTTSMEDELESLKKTLVPVLTQMRARFKSFKVELVLFKDYFESYLHKTEPFTGNMNTLQRHLDTLKAEGGRDIPEAVYEAIYEGVTKTPWSPNSRRVLIVIGDAPPHLRPRGKPAIGQDTAMNAAKMESVTVHTIILPQ